MNAHNKRLAQEGKRRRAAMRRLVRYGFSVNQIAAGNNISRARVYQLLKQKP